MNSFFHAPIFDKNIDGSYKYKDSFTKMHWLHLDIEAFANGFPYASFPMLNFIRDSVKEQLQNALRLGTHRDQLHVDMTQCADVNSFEDLERQILIHKKDAKRQWVACKGTAPWYEIDDLIMKGFLEAVTLFSMAKQAPEPYFPSTVMKT